MNVAEALQQQWIFTNQDDIKIFNVRNMTEVLLMLLALAIFNLFLNITSYNPKISNTGKLSIYSNKYIVEVVTALLRK